MTITVQGVTIAGRTTGPSLSAPQYMSRLLPIVALSVGVFRSGMQRTARAVSSGTHGMRHPL